MNWPDPNITLAPFTYPPISLTYNTVGTYPICIEGFNTNTYGCLPDTFCCDVIVTASTVTSYFTVSQNEGCEDEDFIFTDLSTYDPNNETQWCFDYDPVNGVPMAGATWTPPITQPIIPYQYTHFFTDAGCYYVAVRTENVLSGDVNIYVYQDANGPVPLIIHPKPNTDFIEHDVCIGVQDTWLDDSDIDPLPCNTNIPENINSRVWEVKDPNGIWTNAGSSINLTHTFLTAGTWAIKLTCFSDYGCSEPKEYDITVYDLPIADFYVVPDTICLGDTTIFRDNSIDGSWPVNTWIWDYGDSPTNIDTITTYVDATNSYYYSGNYIVGLTVIDNFGCSNTFEDTINISPNINAFFTSINTVCFEDSSFIDGTGSSSTTDYWSWDFNLDGIEDANGNTVHHTFPNSGWNVITLTTYNYLTTDTCFDSMTDSIYVYANPNTEFTTDTVCFGEQTNFINLTENSIDADSMSYLWEFYDTVGGVVGTITSSMYEPLYEFVDAPGGWFTVSLTMTDTNLCYSTYTDSVLVAEVPTAIVSDTSICNLGTICLTGIHTSESGTFSITQWQWSSPTGSFTPGGDTLEFPCITFNNFGNNQIITLEVTDSIGCTDITSSFIDVYQNPIADFYIDTLLYKLCSNDSVRILDNSQTPSGAPVDSWDWDFDFNASPPNSTFEDNTILYSNTSGDQDILLIITDVNGCTDLLDSTIYLNTPPIASFTATNVCANENVLLTNTSVASSDAGIESANWIYVDGINIPSIDSFYLYQNINEFEGAIVEAIIIVSDSNNCIDSDTVSTIEIHPIPDIDFSTDPICENDNLTFCDNSSFGSSLIFPLDAFTTYNWLFNATDASNLDSCFTLATNDLSYPAGTYNVSLEINTSFYSDASNSYCSETLLQNVIIIDNPEYTDTFILSKYPPCGPSINLNFSSTQNNVSYFDYTFDSPIIYSTNSALDFDIQLTNPYNYSLYVELRNEQEKTCYLFDTLWIPTYPNPVAAFTYNGNLCENEPICFFNESYIADTAGNTYLNSLLLDNDLTNDSLYINSYSWNFGNGSPISADFEPCIDYDAINGQSYTYFPELIITTNNNCTDTILSSGVPISPAPIARIIPNPPNNTGINSGEFYFDGTYSSTSDGSNLSYNAYNFTWITAGDSIRNRPPTPDYITYQYQQGSTYYEIYLLIQDDINGCSSLDSAELFVDYFKGLYVPNALAPNGNSGEPAYFLPKGKSLKAYHLQIFDTWGNMVWETSAISVPDGKPIYPWLGNTLDNKPLPQGTYIWKIYARFTDGTVWPGINGETTGPIYLIR